MTTKEAIEELEYDKELYNTDAQGKPLDLELLEGTPDGLLVDALDMAIEALQKQEPKKPVRDKYNNNCCPLCGHVLMIPGSALYTYAPHCENCGQAIDWSEQEESEE